MQIWEIWRKLKFLFVGNISVLHSIKIQKYFTWLMWNGKQNNMRSSVLLCTKTLESCTDVLTASTWNKIAIRKEHRLIMLFNYFSKNYTFTKTLDTCNPYSDNFYSNFLSMYGMIHIIVRSSVSVVWVLAFKYINLCMDAQ